METGKAVERRGKTLLIVVEEGQDAFEFECDKYARLAYNSYKIRAVRPLTLPPMMEALRLVRTSASGLVSIEPHENTMN